MRTIYEEVNVSETFWPRQGEMIIVLLKAAKDTQTLVTFHPGFNIFTGWFWFMFDDNDSIF